MTDVAEAGSGATATSASAAATAAMNPVSARRIIRFPSSALSHRRSSELRQSWGSVLSLAPNRTPLSDRWREEAVEQFEGFALRCRGVEQPLRLEAV